MIQALRKQLVRGVALAALLILSGCSTFNRDWKSAAAKPMPANSVEGRWEGKWHSDHNGHTGGLRALVTKLDSGQYEARFHATYAVVLSFSSTVNLDVRPAGGLQQFSGSADLGKAATAFAWVSLSDFSACLTGSKFLFQHDFSRFDVSLCQSGCLATISLSVDAVQRVGPGFENSFAQRLATSSKATLTRARRCATKARSATVAKCE